MLELKFTYEMRVCRRQPRSNLLENGTARMPTRALIQYTEMRMKHFAFGSLRDSQYIGWIVCFVALIAERKKIRFFDRLGDALAKPLNGEFFIVEGRFKVDAAKPPDFIASH